MVSFIFFVTCTRDLINELYYYNIIIIIQHIGEEVDENNPIILQILEPENQLKNDAWHMQDVTCRNEPIVNFLFMDAKLREGCG